MSLTKIQKRREGIEQKRLSAYGKYVRPNPSDKEGRKKYNLEHRRLKKYDEILAKREEKLLKQQEERDEKELKAEKLKNAKVGVKSGTKRGSYKKADRHPMVDVVLKRLEKDGLTNFVTDKTLAYYLGQDHHTITNRRKALKISKSVDYSSKRRREENENIKKIYDIIKEETNGEFPTVNMKTKRKVKQEKELDEFMKKTDKFRGMKWREYHAYKDVSVGGFGSKREFYKYYFAQDDGFNIKLENYNWDEIED